MNTDTDDVLAVDQSFVARPAEGGGTVTLWSPEAGTELRLGRSAQALLARFAVPTSAKAVLSTVPDTARDAAERAIESLVAGGILRSHAVTADPGGTQRGLFGAPVTSLAKALTDPALDIVAVGIEYDAGASARSGSKTGPDAIRRVAASIYAPNSDRGMWDPAVGRRILDGVRMADIGNLGDVVQMRNGPVLDRLAGAVEAIASARKVPVVLGGDHSITHAVVRGLLSAVDGGLGLLHFDAHTDYFRPAHGDWRSSLHHGNVMSWVAGEARVERIAQFGIRQRIDDDPQADSSKTVVWGGRSALAADLDELLDSVPAHLAWHVTIDVDVLDPAFMPSTGTPVPGGFSHLELTDLISALVSRRRIVGVDVVELIGEGEGAHRSALAAADLLVRTLDAAFSSRASPR
ncbi:arginase family protein [Curtobacterium sp. MCBA15_012]|uniref:arginase family protein n=1 Tax=Curtobacterium sp. MCBA15_012 TaxID=1898738 RepID=UPI0008DCFB16|nr:arginase family protein [Curtobacterium sp. MCBA15_012]WIB00407.1 arginase family protein [Curtobacterium sp. MCBA15_012]